MNRHLSLLILAVLLPCLAMALTLSVKQDGSGDYTAIQAALDAANPGDTVLVHPGRYFENLTIESNNITLMSLETTTGNPAYIDSTIIDGNHSDRRIRARSNEAVISGFSLTNGLSLGAGGGISISNMTTVINCKIFGNQARTGGDVGGIASITSVNNPRIDIINCTFAGNQGNAYTLKTNGEVNIVNSIFYNDTPYQIKVEPMDGDPNEHTNLTIDHALVKDGINGILPYPVPGNTIDLLPSSLNTDPFFTGGDDIHDPLYYSLSALSPCINSGTPDTLGLFLPPYDLAGNWRVWNGQIDMGCFEFGAPPVANDDPLALIPPALSLNAYPNPFSAFTTILLNTPVASEGRPESKRKSSLCIYNIKGQKVKNLSFVASPSGEITSWDGRNEEGIACANGIYLLQLQIDGVNKGIRKVTLIK